MITEEGYLFSWKDLIRKPAGEFLSRYFQGEGYKDGLQVLALAGLQGFSEFVMYLKIWQNEKFKKESIKIGEVTNVMKEVTRDLNYWQAGTLFKNGGSIVERFKRKYKIF